MQTTKNEFSSTSVLRQIVLLCAAVMMMSSVSLAQVFYEFIPSSDSGSDDLSLATLELTSLPADHTDAGEFTFTASGDSRFGFDASFVAVFETSFGEVIADGSGGLRDTAGGAAFIDESPTGSSLFAGGIQSFEIGFGAPANADFLRLTALDPAEGFVEAFGDWRTVLVPEPSGGVLVFTSVVFGALVGTRRRRSCSSRRRTTRRNSKNQGQ